MHTKDAGKRCVYRALRLYGTREGIRAIGATPGGGVSSAKSVHAARETSTVIGINPISTHVCGKGPSSGRVNTQPDGGHKIASIEHGRGKTSSSKGTHEQRRSFLSFGQHPVWSRKQHTQPQSVSSKRYSRASKECAHAVCHRLTYWRAVPASAAALGTRTPAAVPLPTERAHANKRSAIRAQPGVGNGARGSNTLTATQRQLGGGKKATPMCWVR